MLPIVPCFILYFFKLWHRSFTFNSNKLPTWCNSFLVYYPDVCLQLNMFRAFSRPSSGAQWLQWQPLFLTSYRGDSRAVSWSGRPAGPTTNTARLSRLLTEMSTNCQGGRCIELTTLPPSWAVCLEIRGFFAYSSPKNFSFSTLWYGTLFSFN
jgi:hypothetical protein